MGQDEFDQTFRGLSREYTDLQLWKMNISQLFRYPEEKLGV